MSIVFDPTDSTQFPAYTSKQDILRAIDEMCVSVPGSSDLLFRLSNTDLTGLTDGDERYLDEGIWSTSETIT